MTIITRKQSKNQLLKQAEKAVSTYDRYKLDRKTGKWQKKEEAPPPGREEAGAPGLLTAHISTQAHLEIWPEGSKIIVKRKNEYFKGSGANLDNKRGTISGFSRGSRRRFQRTLAETNRNIIPLFSTLTFPDEYHQHIKNPAHWKAILNRLYARFERKFKSGAYFWREEMQDRKSGKYIGEYFPHFHLLVYGVDLHEFRSWLAENWYEVCGKLSEAHLKAGTQTKMLSSVREVFSYVSKYMAKEGVHNLNTGRIWGVARAENIPWVQALLIPLTENEAITLIRYMRRYARLKGRDYKSLTILLDAGWWYERLLDILYPP